MLNKRDLTKGQVICRVIEKKLDAKKLAKFWIIVQASE